MAGLLLGDRPVARHADAAAPGRKRLRVMLTVQIPTEVTDDSDLSARRRPRLLAVARAQHETTKTATAEVVAASSSNSCSAGADLIMCLGQAPLRRCAA